jgi:hypothetical protein
MNANQMINMVIRMVMRRLMRSGVNAGMDAMGKRLSKDGSAAPPASETQKRARSTLKIARRMGRM